MWKMLREPMQKMPPARMWKMLWEPTARLTDGRGGGGLQPIH